MRLLPALLAAALLATPALAQPRLAQGGVVAGGTTADAGGALQLGSSTGLVAPGRSTAGGLTLEGGFWYGAASDAAACDPPGGPLPVISLFDENGETDCWTAPGTQGVEWVVTNGGGHLRAVDAGAGPVRFVAPAAYAGGYPELYGSALRFELAINGVLTTENPQVVLGGPQGTIRYDTDRTPSAGFSRFDARLTEQGWVDDATGGAVSEADFRATLSALSSLEIWATATDQPGDETVLLDNVSLGVTGCSPRGGPYPVRNTFSDGLDCWQASIGVGAELQWDPNGWIVATETAQFNSAITFDAPIGFTGGNPDLYGTELTFRAAVDANEPMTQSVVVILYERSATIRYDTGQALTGSFAGFTVPLTEAGWVNDGTGEPIDEAAFRSVIRNYSSMRIWASATNVPGQESVRLDDVVLGAPAGDAPPPPSGTPPLYVEVPAPVGDGDTFEATVYAGTAADPVADLFGVAFDLDLSNAAGDGVQRVEYVSARAPETDCDGDGQADRTVFQAFPSGTPTGEVALAFSLRGDECPAGLDGRVPVAVVTLTALDGGDQTLGLSGPTANDSAGRPITLDPVALTFAVTDGLVVWPGDTDDSGLVDAQDLLPIGARFGVTGPARDSTEQGIEWEPRAAPVWPTPSDTYVDANGDGEVDAADVLAVGLNFGRTQPAPATAPAALATATPAGTRQAATVPVRASVAAGALAELVVPVQPVGTEIPVAIGTRADGILGAAALLALPAGLAAVDAGPSARLDDGDVLTFWSATADGVDVAATRKRGADLVSGGGDLLTVVLRVEAEMEGPATVALARLTLGTAEGSRPAPAGAASLASPFAVAAEGAPAAAFGLASVAPNPSRDRATIRLGLDAPAGDVRVVVYDALGREVAVLWDGPRGAGEHEVSLAASGLAPGVYLVRLTAGDRADVRQLTVVR